MMSSLASESPDLVEKSSIADGESQSLYVTGIFAMGLLTVLTILFNLIVILVFTGKIAYHSTIIVFLKSLVLMS